jgi:hypothetical protein
MCLSAEIDISRGIRAKVKAAFFHAECHRQLAFGTDVMHREAQCAAHAGNGVA